MNYKISIDEYVRYTFCIALLSFIFITPYSLYHIFTILPICFLPFLALFLKKNYSELSIKQIRYLSIAWGIIFLSSMLIGKLPPPVYFILLACSYAFISCRIAEREKIAKLFLSIYTTILSLSLIEYIFYLCGWYISLGNANRIGVDIYNYIQLPLNLIQISNISRFQSLANEPGLIGTLNALLLFNLNRESYTKEYLILIITGLFTLSLAFYILLILHFLISLKSLKSIAISSLIVSLIVIFAISNQDKSEIQNLIWRIELGKDADNRTSNQFKMEYEEFLDSKECWFGKGLGALNALNIVDGGNDGIYRLTYEVGYIGIFLLIIVYSYIIYSSKGNKSASIFFIIAFWLSFYQRSGIIQPHYILVAAMPYLNMSSSNRIINNKYYT